MKKILLLLSLLMAAFMASSQVYSIAQEPVCWTTPTSVDSSLNRYVMLSNLDNQPPRILSYLNGSGGVVDVSGGGTIAPGYCGTIVASMIVDEIQVQEDSIIVLLVDGAEISRDTVGPFGGEDGNGMFDIANQDSLWAVTRYYLPLQHYGYIREKGGWVLQDSSLSRYAGENLITVFASSGTTNPPVIRFGGGNYTPQISIEGDTAVSGGRVTIGTSGQTYDLPIKDPDAYGLPPGEYFPLVDQLGAPGGTGGWGRADNLIDSTQLADTLSLFERIYGVSRIPESGATINGTRFRTLGIVDNVDSIFVFPVGNTDDVGENLLYNAKEIRTTVTGVAGAGTTWATIVGGLHYEYGTHNPLSDYPVTLCEGYTALRVSYNLPDTVHIGDTLTFSIDVARPPGVESDMRVYSPSSQGSVIFDVTESITSNWERKVFKLVTTRAATARSWQFFMSVSDSAYLSRPQLERGATASYFQPTERNAVLTSSQRYAVQEVEDGKLILSNIKSLTSRTDAEILQAAYDFCAGGRCNEIIMSGEWNVTRELFPAQDVVLIGSTTLLPNVNTILQQEVGEIGTLIKFSPSTPQNLFTFRKPDDDPRVFNSAGIRNIHVHLTDTAKNIIDIINPNGFIVENFLITAESGIQLDTAINLTDESPSDAYWNSFKNIKIRTGGKVGIHTAIGGLDNIFQDVDITAGFDISVSVSQGRFTCNSCILQSSEIGLKAVNCEVYSNDFYTEQVGNVLTVENSRINLTNSTLKVGNTTVDTLLYFDDLSTVSLDFCRLTDGSRGISSPGTRITISNSQTAIDPFGLFPGNDDYITSINNRDANGFHHPNKFAPFYAKQVSFTKAYIDSLYTPSKILLGNTTIEGFQQNLVGNSEAFLTAGTYYSSGTDSIIVKEDNFMAPDGTTTAETIIYQGNDVGASVVGTFSNPEKVYNVGDKLVLSAWVYPHSRYLVGDIFVYRPNNRVSNDVTVEAIAPQDAWTRIVQEFEVTESGSPNSVIRLTTPGVVGAYDSISVWGLQVNDTPFPISYTQTTGAYVESTTAQIGGDIEFTGTLTASNLPTFLTATTTLDFGATNASAITDLTLTVTGAATGDAVTVGAPPGSAGQGVYFGFVSADDTVTIRFLNDTAGAYDPPSGDFTVTVIQN